MDFSKIILHEFSDWLYPPKCVICTEVLPLHTKQQLCEKCKENIPWISLPVCQKCGRPLEETYYVCERCQQESFAFEKGIAVFTYDKVRTSIARFKFKGVKGDGIALGNIMAQYLLIYYATLIQEIDFIFPIPMFFKKKKARGFNQAEILAQQLEEKIKIPCVIDNLVRIKNTIPQSKLDVSQRKVNIKDAFEVKDKKEIEGKIILLVDDIFTTGNTVNECAKELLKWGAYKVFFYALAVVDEKTGN